MEIKFELDTDKAAKAAVAIVTVHAFSRISLATDLPSLAAANALATIIVITILYAPLPGLLKTHLGSHDARRNHAPLQGGA
jgi:hypothetical protein